MYLALFAAVATCLLLGSYSETADEAVPISSKYFYENFDAGWETRWVRSEAKKDGVDSNIAKYNGNWEVTDVADSNALVMEDAHRHYAISSLLKEKFVFASEPLVVQYEVKFQEAPTCGGAYLKLLSSTKEGFSGNNFFDKSHYTILFGPDKCGSDSKLLFIFRHLNPINNEYREIIHLPIGDLNEKLFNFRSHLLTLIIRPDNTFSIHIDQLEVAEGTLGSNDAFKPALLLEKIIDDPNDKKPSDWVDNAKIDDPEDEKPEDWDETQPAVIPDTTATKPDEWDENAPEVIPDPEATKPEDWNDEEDGEWEAPEINNPQCDNGCGLWSPPLIPNPNYKGIWKPRQIDNPLFKGIWKPRQIDNPDYFEDFDPFHSLSSIVAVGFELWTTFSGTSFDNILITNDETEAEKAAKLWLVKKLKDDEKYGKADGIFQRIENIFSNLVEAADESPYLYAVYLLILVIPVLLLVSRSSPKPVATHDNTETESSASHTEAPKHTKNDNEASGSAATPTSEAQQQPAETVEASPTTVDNDVKRETTTESTSSDHESKPSDEPTAAAVEEEEPQTPRRSLRKRATKATAE